MQVFLVDAFSAVPGKGNPAGVVLAAEQLDAGSMQQIAAEVGASETAFLWSLQPGLWQNRFFTPRREVAICGHATIATFYLLHRQQRLAAGQPQLQRTLAGDLTVTVAADASSDQPVIWMDLDQPAFSTPACPLVELLAALGLDEGDLEPRWPLAVAQQNRIFLPLRSLQRLLDLRPELARLAQLSDGYGWRGVVPYALETLSADCRTHLRHFAPAAGVAEDPVTGTSNGYLGVLLQAAGVFPAGSWSYTAEQGQAIGRDGRVQVQLSPGRVQIGGTACLGGQRQITLEDR